MEYVFGTKGAAEILKTKGDSHSGLTGYRQIERKYPDQTITDNFHIVRLLDSREDDEGNCYDWYEIDRHYRAADKSGAVAAKAAENVAALEDAMCEEESATDARIEELENAICELDAQLNG